MVLWCDVHGIAYGDTLTPRYRNVGKKKKTPPTNPAVSEYYCIPVGHRIQK